ncbi:hypothetical protein ACCD10_32255 [Pseudomonas sp. Pseusp122]|uniref:hypothetical protein n=1 Tax=unclassified Pseudomonas TaxID=196821 RepID=UPI0039A59518
MNVYWHTFTAVCPSDGDMIIYRLKIRSLKVIVVEHIKRATTLIKSGYQKRIADELADRIGGVQTIVATQPNRQR